jgi:hypothetical protein
MSGYPPAIPGHRLTHIRWVESRRFQRRRIEENLLNGMLFHWEGSPPNSGGETKHPLDLTATSSVKGKRILADDDIHNQPFSV